MASRRRAPGTAGGLVFGDVPQAPGANFGGAAGDITSALGGFVNSLQATQTREQEQALREARLALEQQALGQRASEGAAERTQRSELSAARDALERELAGQRSGLERDLLNTRLGTERDLAAQQADLERELANKRLQGTQDAAALSTRLQIEADEQERLGERLTGFAMASLSAQRPAAEVQQELIEKFELTPEEAELTLFNAADALSKRAEVTARTQLNTLGILAQTGNDPGLASTGLNFDMAKVLGLQVEGEDSPIVQDVKQRLGSGETPDEVLAFGHAANLSDVQLKEITDYFDANGIPYTQTQADQNVPPRPNFRDLTNQALEGAADRQPF